MRWPFGPPHLTLKPSKKNKKKQQKNKNKKEKKTKKKTTKKQKKKKNQERKRKKHKNTKKRAFQLSVKIFFFLTGYPKIAFFDTLAQKTRTQKHYKNRGFSLFFWKKVMRHETAIFGQKKTQIQKFQLSFFFLPFFSFKNKKTQKSAETPIFIVF